MPKYGELRKLQQLFESVYLIKDPYILKMLLASVISQDLPQDPIWIIVVAPSGGAKSEFINSLSGCRGVSQLSTLSTNTFASGMRVAGQETSLLNKIGANTETPGNGIITFKDLTSLLSERPDDRSIIMGQLREIYDGHYIKQFGNGKEVDWTGKITVIAGATYSIYRMKREYSAMGERFLMYNMIQPDRKEAADKAMSNQESGKIKEDRLMLAEAVSTYKNKTIELPTEKVKISPELKNELLDLSELATRSRSSVERNWRSPQQEITEVHPPEMPTRFASVLQSYSRSLMIMNWNEYGKMEILPEDKTILYKLALDSIDRQRRIAMQELSRYDVIETSGLAVKLKLPANSVRRWLEELTALEIVHREKQTGPKGDRWSIIPKYREIIHKFEGIELIGGELTETSLGEDNEHNIISEEEIVEAMK